MSQQLAAGSSDETSAQNEQKATDASRQDLVAAYKQEAAQQSTRWSVTSPLKLTDGNSQDEPDLFHHSESATNMTVAPDAARQQAQDQSGLQQQVQPTSSTPVYSRQSAEADAVQQASRREEFAERSSTTRDPLFGQVPSNELLFGAPVSTEQSSGSNLSASTESRPQVGAILSSDSDQSLQSLVAVEAAQDNDRNNSGNSSFTSTSSNDSAVTTSTDTISDSTINNNQQQISPSQTATSSMAPSTTSELPLASVANSGTTESGQTSNQTLIGEQAISNKSRRLVQSEFGFGVQQKPQAAHRESVAKSARSTGRFEFVRNQSSPPGDALFSGQLSAYPKSNGPGEQQAANHKYGSLANDALDSSAFQLYSTSANQGSVSYIPLDEQSFLPSLTRNQDEPANQEPQKNAQTSTRKLNRRFGARLAANSPIDKRIPTNTRNSVTAPRTVTSVSR